MLLVCIEDLGDVDVLITDETARTVRRPAIGFYEHAAGLEPLVKQPADRVRYRR